mmetsp:Transcript_19745/g.42556  ORF Transcript_19745/g.42556 Transcript_19745/m.42556 type:complete len:256 (-) Transcript_19745:1122-1889(-)
MINSLSHLGEQVKNVSVIVQQRSFSNVIIETRTRGGVQSLVEVLFLRVKLQSTNRNDARWEIHVFRPCFLCSAQQAFIKNFILEQKHGSAAISLVPVPLNNIENLTVEVAIVRKCAMSAVFTNSFFHFVMDTLAIATFCFAEVVRMRFNLQEADQTVELSNSILERGSTQAPTMNSRQCKRSCSSLTRATLDVVRFVQHNPPPAKGMKDAELCTIHGFFSELIQVDTGQGIILIILVAFRAARVKFLPFALSALG